MFSPELSSRRNLARRSSDRRRGVAILVVLSLISISLALSYAMLRSQATALRIHENLDRLSDARSAALSGMTAAIGKMHQPDWQGVSVPVTGNFGNGGSYSVSFTPGDSRLSPSHPDYSDWPYRVTLSATGYASDPAASGQISIHRIRAVVRLRPQRLYDAPAAWQKMQNYTVYQCPGDNFVVQTPARIEGPVLMTGALSLCSTYPSDTGARMQYLSDLERMRQAGRTDNRPFNGPIRWDILRNGVASVEVGNWLGVPVTTLQASDVGQLSVPVQFDRYRLYTGGPAYEIPRIGEVLENISLEPDPDKNPLGIYFRSGSVQVRSNVSIVGSLVATDDIEITGSGIQVTACEFQSIEGSDRPPRFPALCAGDDVRFHSSARASIQGAVWAADEFEIRDGPETAEIVIEGRVIAKNFAIRGRWPWYYTTDTWSQLYTQFLFQRSASASGSFEYFPAYLAALGRSSTPRIVIKPAATPKLDHWQSAMEPVYLPLQTGAGLKWDIIDWVDNST
jgi:hypothetical protein